MEPDSLMHPLSLHTHLGTFDLLYVLLIPDATSDCAVVGHPPIYARRETRPASTTVPTCRTLKSRKGGGGGGRGSLLRGGASEWSRFAV